MSKETKYKVGDRVTIKRRMKSGMKYGRLTLLSQMKMRLQGGTFKIDEVSGLGSYHLEDHTSFGFYVTDEMILRKVV